MSIDEINITMNNFEKNLEEMLISCDLSINEQINFVLKNFFSICLIIEKISLKNIFDLISKLFSKLKLFKLLNLLISYYEIIEKINQKIYYSITNKYNFDIKKDTIIEPLLENTLQIFITSTSKEKFNFLIEKLENELINKNKNQFLQYKIIYGKYPKGHILQIRFLDNFLFINENTNRELNKKYEEIKIKNSLKYYEYYIRENFSNNRKTKEFRESYEKLKNIILIDENFSNEIKEIYPFGSVTQFSQTINSDLEITIIMKNYENYNIEDSNSFLEKIKIKLENEYQNEYENIKLIATKRTYLLDIFDKTNNIKIEVNLNNIFGILNSSLIREYLIFDSRVLILVNIIKNWSKLKEINGNHEKFLSSYCYTLMVIFFLQRINNPIIPIISSKENLIKIKICNKEYFFEESLIYPKNDILKFESHNNDSLSILLLKFFIFYYYIFSEEIYCIDISNEKLIERKEKINYMNFTKNQKCFYCFIDMFDYSYNPGGYLYNYDNYKEIKENMKKSIEDMFNGINIFYSKNENS